MDQDYVDNRARENLREAIARIAALQASAGGATYAMEENALNAAVLEAETIYRLLVAARVLSNVVRLWHVR